MTDAAGLEARQLVLKQQLVAVDAPADLLSTLRYIGGMDISFVKDDPERACACLTVLSAASLHLEYSACRIVQITTPYVPGFLGFREVPALMGLLEELRTTRPDLVPDVILLDGNGVLHPRGFGLACHLGVVADIPTIGVAKTLLHLPGMPSEKDIVARHARCAPGDALPIHLEPVVPGVPPVGMTLRSSAGSTKPVFVSQGHRVALDTAVDIVRRTTLYRVPEPVRQADMLSRKALRMNVGQLP